MKNMAMVVFFGAMALVGTLVACGGSDTAPAKSPDNSASAASSAAPAPADTSASSAAAPAK